MAIDRFEAVPQVLVLDEQAGQFTGSATVTFKTDSPEAMVLWERVSDGPWVRVAGGRVQPVPNSPAEFRFATPALAPGQSYTAAGSADARFNPEVIDDSVSSREATVIAARKVPQKAQVITDGPSIRFGGTFVSAAATSADKAFAMFEVGGARPTKGPDGLLEFPTGILSRSQHATASTQHVFELTSGLAPGMTVHYVFLAVDTSGDYEERSGQVTLLRRVVTVDVQKLHIRTPDDAGAAEAAFRLAVCEDATPVAHYNLRSEADPLTIHAGSDILLPEGADPPGWRTTVGPLGPSTRGVGLLVRGSEYDDGPGPTVHAGSFDNEMVFGIPDSFAFRVGSDRETMHEFPFSLYCSPMEEDSDLTFDTIGTYSVTYVP